MESLGTTIKNLRLFRGYSQRKLAERLNKTVNTIANWEKDLSSPDLKTAAEICKVLDVTPNQLLGWDEIREYTDYMIELEGQRIIVESKSSEIKQLNSEISEIQKKYGKLLNNRDFKYPKYI